MNNVKIISDGTARGTKVLVGGVEMVGVSEIRIDPIRPGGLVTATISLLAPGIDHQAAQVEKKFETWNPVFGTSEEFTSACPPEWLTREWLVPGSKSHSYRDFWDQKVLTLEVGESVKCYTTTITRIA